ncbi:S24/S26 family peptidase [Aneurinibacillus aneurinilyticus]|nr:S24/S26 family peptidase [Aneurinibacillus aneurinilyticus]MCI1694162.1 S24/S26 family peptidase [Aneurinibacillus aneurinilyticus]
MERLYQVSGCSMEPTLRNGQIVEVVEGYRDGDVVVAEHEGRLVVKRLVGDRLLGDNRALSADFFVADVRILGRAEVRTKEELEERGVQLDNLHFGKVLAATLYNDDSPWEFVKKDWYSVVSNRLFTSYSFDPLLNHYNPAGKAKSWNTSNGLDAGEVAYQVGDNTTSIMKYEAIEQGSPYYNIYQKNASKNSVQMGPEWEIVYKRAQPPSTATLDLKPYLADTAYEYRAYASISGLKYYYSQWGLGEPDIPTTPQLINEIPNANVVAGIRNDTNVTITYYIGKKKKNSNPTLTLSTQNNHALFEGSVLSITGSASDADNGDVLTVKYKINSGTVRNIASGVATGTPLSFAKNLTFSNKRLRDGSTEITGDLAENVDHTLTVWAEDDKGGKSAEVTREFRVIHNRPPVISGTNEDLGTIQAMPSKAYTVTEPEKDAFTVTEKINGKVIRSFAGVDGQENTIAIPHDIWIRLQPGIQHKLVIEATDSKGMAAARTYTFVRQETKLEFKLKQPFITDIAAKRILVTLDAVVPNGATMKIEACNNAFDASPAWEDITNHVRFNRGFLFTNTEKTAEQWGVNIRFIFEKGTAASQVIVNGFGGAFD